MNLLSRACWGLGLTPLAYHALAPGAVRLSRRLRTQLELMRGYSTSRLDEAYPKVLDRNGWPVGTGNGCEEILYWLAGMVLLAHVW